MRSLTAFQAMLNRQPPNTYFHPEAGSSFPTNRYGFLLFCLHSTYEDLERNKESMQTLKDFLNAAKAWVKNLPLDVGKKLNFMSFIDIFFSVTPILLATLILNIF